MKIGIFSLEIQSFERQTNDAVMDLANDDGTHQKGPMIQKTKWLSKVNDLYLSKRICHFRDRKKKKFVTVGQTDAKTKKVKTESGQWIQASYKTDVYVLLSFPLILSTILFRFSYKKWLNKSKAIDKELPDSRRNRSQDYSQNDETSTAQGKPGNLTPLFFLSNRILFQDNYNNV